MLGVVAILIFAKPGGAVGAAAAGAWPAGAGLLAAAGGALLLGAAGAGAGLEAAGVPLVQATSARPSTTRRGAQRDRRIARSWRWGGPCRAVRTGGAAHLRRVYYALGLGFNAGRAIPLLNSRRAGHSSFFIQVDV